MVVHSNDRQLMMNVACFVWYVVVAEQRSINSWQIYLHKRLVHRPQPERNYKHPQRHVKMALSFPFSCSCHPTGCHGTKHDLLLLLSYMLNFDRLLYGVRSTQQSLHTGAGRLRQGGTGAHRGPPSSTCVEKGREACRLAATPPEQPSNHRS